MHTFASGTLLGVETSSTSITLLIDPETTIFIIIVQLFYFLCASFAKGSFCHSLDVPYMCDILVACSGKSLCRGRYFTSS